MEWTCNDGELEPKSDTLLAAEKLMELRETWGEALDRMSEAVRLALGWWRDTDEANSPSSLFGPGEDAGRTRR